MKNKRNNRFNKRRKIKLSKLGNNRGYVKFILERKTDMKIREYKINKIEKLASGEYMKVDTETEIILTPEEAKKMGLVEDE